MVPTTICISDDSSSTRSKEVLQELENIDGKMAMPFVKLEDMTVAREYGVRDELPALIYFEEGVPSVYEGDCSNEEEVLEWLVKQHAEDSIEEITEEILEDLIIDREYVLVLFAPDDCGKECDDILLELENIDDDLDQYGTLLVTTSDVRLLRRQVSPSVSLPALVMFRHGEPMLYHGDLMNEDKILAWATSDEVLDQPGKIDEVQKKLLEKMLNLTDFLVVYFYSPRCSECERALRSLERVDDQLDNTDLNMVKVSDPKVINQYNIRVFPSLTFFKNKMPVFYDGDLHSAEQVLEWIMDVKMRPFEQIDYIKDGSILEELLEESKFFVVYFYQEKDDILRGLEAIYEDLEKYELKLVKTNVVSIAEELGFTEFPCLVYFENKMPSIYAGDLWDESAVLEWLIHQKTEDTIENINRGLLFRMIEEQQYLTVFFYVPNDPESQEILKHLEMIDDDCSDYEIQFVRMADPLMAKKYGVREPPGLVFFRNGKAVKYPGDLLDEEEVLEWLTSPENMELSDAIEKVNRRMFERVLARTEFLAVLYYTRERCRQCDRTLEELEKIDDDADEEGIKFVKIDDPKMAHKYGVYAIPAIVFYKDEEDYVIYAGNLLDGGELLEWLLKMKDPSGDVIEEVDDADLVELIDTAEYVAVFFYPDEESECEECAEILADLENIDDDTDRHGIRFVKSSDPTAASRYGVEELPALVYFEHRLPSVFEGDLSAEEEVLQWLIQQKTEDTIETVNREMLDRLVQDEQYLAVYFYKPHCKACDQVLQELENIDDDLDDFGIHIVKTSDSGVAKRYGLKSFPALVYYRNQNPLVYDGNLRDEAAVLEWLTDEDTRELEDEIEAINARMLERLIGTSDYLAVIFYDTETDDFTEILQELEEIDDDAELFGIDFVKVNDLEAAVHWNIRNFPTVAYFRKGIPTFYEGDLTDAERVLRWLTSHDMIEIKDEIEGVNRRMLEKLLEDNDYVAVLFLADDLEAGQNASLEVLDNLEDIDLEVSELDLLFVKLSDPKFAKRYGLTELPSLIYFRRRFPNVFRGK
ncbi:hypothetical protein LAZ67_13002327 [Cordylochernes scorpioides]|uniref:Thioredoxin domain-containing protein n=1 Tax=Cordylochernes scorpioides TaxID=51811 RepID=A0ABY6L4H7_9ARAC|nr:hypothetical protein LAZ67_13002327 [Cordylochernes scorpioides]